MIKWSRRFGVAFLAAEIAFAKPRFSFEGKAASPPRRQIWVPGLWQKALLPWSGRKHPKKAVQFLFKQVHVRAGEKEDKTEFAHLAQERPQMTLVLRGIREG